MLPANQQQGTAVSTRLPPGARKTAFALVQNVLALIEEYGIEHIVFNTLTFKELMLDAKEAQRRLHSLTTNVLSKRYLDYILVVERRDDGCLHYHIIAAVDYDVRAGFNFEEVSQKIYNSVSTSLKKEWKFWRTKAKKYGFGRTEQLPIRTTAEAVADYVGKYINKHLNNRIAEDKGKRLVRYSSRARTSSASFAWNTPHAKLWRRRLAAWAGQFGFQDIDDISAAFGPRWVWTYKEQIMSQPLDINTLPYEVACAYCESERLQAQFRLDAVHCSG